MSECFLSGRGQGHVSNFYIVDLENFATASRRYTGDIHNSSVVGLFMTPETMGADSFASWLSAHVDYTLTSTKQARREELSNSFFREICNPNSCLNYLLPPKRDTLVTSRLRAATPYPRPTLRTKKYCSFINYGLSHYQ